MSRLPDPVVAATRDVVGGPGTIERLGGLSGAWVFRVRGPAGTVVAKGRVHDREVAVYEHLATVFTDAGLRIPHCRERLTVEGEKWLLLEDLPDPLPRSRWGADPELVGFLSRLHGLPPDVLDVVPVPFAPRWDESMTSRAVRRLDLDPVAEQALDVVRRATVHLFDPVSVVSGDPNPLNWGLSAEGELTLMDWERIGAGHPAVDLAIALPGLPTPDEAAAMIAAYRSIDPRGTFGTSVTDLLCAKAWTVVELAADPRLDGGDARSDVLAGLHTSFAPWLSTIPGELDRPEQEG